MKEDNRGSKFLKIQYTYRRRVKLLGRGTEASNGSTDDKRHENNRDLSPPARRRTRCLTFIEEQISVGFRYELPITHTIDLTSHNLKCAGGGRGVALMRTFDLPIRSARVLS